MIDNAISATSTAGALPEQGTVNREARRRFRRSFFHYLGATAFVGSYLFLVYWFSTRAGFWADGSSPPTLFFALYNFLRLAYLGYFLVFTTCTGVLVLRWLDARGTSWPPVCWIG